MLTANNYTPAAKPHFFRDTVGLDLVKRAVQEHLQALSPDKEFRVWVPQCAAGQDAYSVAICLIEAMGNRWREIPLRVFSTDSDTDSLARARAGRYPPESSRDISNDTLERFFVQESDGLSVRPFVREACRFAGHDLALSPPFSRLNLIACRETLAELPSGTRKDALRHFHSALAPNGVLLDQTGTAVEAPELFHPVGSGRTYMALGASARTRPTFIGSYDGNATARLQESEDRFRALFSQAEDAILILDAETDLILEVNEAAQRLYGWSVPELLGFRARDLVVAPEALRRAKSERRSEERLRLPHYRRKDGTVFPGDTSTAFLMRQGRPCHLWMMRDATVRLRMSSVRKHDEAHAAFMGEVVHELRSPLALIQGSAETLRRGVRKTRDRNSLLGFIESHTARMAQLVDRLLDLSASNAAERKSPVRVPLAEFIWGTVSAFAPIAKRRGIRIKLDVPEDMALLADPADLPHIFGNLLDNALKFTPKRGEVFIRARAEGGDGVVSIRDTGGGIAPGDLSRVFERFFRCERTQRIKGTGLGLAIVHAAVKANGGHISAGNDAAGGAIFHVALPLFPREGIARA